METNKKEEVKQKNRERSVAYPSLNLENSVELISKLRSELGKGPYSREDVARGLGYAGISGASTRAVAALVHYGLLNRSGNTYFMSELAEEITHSTDESGEKRRQSIVIAAKLPRLFLKIIDRFQNQSLPGLLENILVREGVSNNSAKEVANILKETLQFSGILQNGVVVNSSDVSIKEKTENQIKSNPFADFGDFNFINNKGQKDTPYFFNDSGDGWSVAIKSEKPITSKIKKLIIDAMELLETKEDK